MKMDTLRLIGGTSVDFPIIGANPSGPFVLKSVEGLGPPEVNVRMARSTFNKASFQGKTPALRQIIALVGLQPNWDEGQRAEALRTTLYGLLTPTDRLPVRAQILYQGVIQAYAQGHISKFEAALFSKDPAVQITLECDHPFLLAWIALSTPAPVVTSDANGSVINIPNPGTAPSGFVVGVVLNSDVGTTLNFSNYTFVGEYMSIVGIDWLVGDKFKIDTREGSRGVWRATGTGPYVSILNNMNASVSTWFQIHGGDNQLYINSPSITIDGANKFNHHPAYWGV